MSMLFDNYIDVNVDAEQLFIAFHLCRNRCICQVTFLPLYICISADVDTKRRHLHRYLPLLSLSHLSQSLSLFIYNNHPQPPIVLLSVTIENVTKILKLPFLSIIFVLFLYKVYLVDKIDSIMIHKIKYFIFIAIKILI